MSLRSASFVRIITNVSVAAFLLLASTAYALCAAPATGGVTISLESNLQQTVASASVGYTATIQNPGTMSYSGATIAVEVRDASGAIVDRFVQPGVDVSAGSSAHPTFVWHTSGVLARGQYQVEAIFVPQGVSYGDAFTDARLPHATVPMTISSGPASLPSFSAPLSVANGALTASVTNRANAPYRGTVTWRAWSVDDAGQPYQPKTAEVEILPNGSASAQYTLPQSDKAMYVEAMISVSGDVQAVTGAWVKGGKVSPTNTSCEADMFGIGSIGIEIALLVVVLLLVLAAWSRIRKHKPVTP